MGIEEWTSQNWFNLISAAGIVGTILFTAYSAQTQSKTQRLANLLIITSNHREVWREFLRNQALGRVLNASADPLKPPVSYAEEIFVGMVVLHISSVYYATRDELVVKLDGLRRDVSEFLSLPIPRAIWEKIKILQNDDFVAFVESCRNWK